MEKEWQPDAIVRVKLDNTLKEFIKYIDKNIDQIETTIPVFYGQVVTTLANTSPDINDDLHDHFIDNITLHILDVSKRSTEIEFVEKLFNYAKRHRRSNKGNAIYDIMLGMKMINTGKYNDAIEKLKAYRTIDALICPAMAYCYFVLSTQQNDATESSDPVMRPNQMALGAREQMIEMVRINPPVNRLKDLGYEEDPRINKIFWFMIKEAIQWFPSEREFLRIAIEKAGKDQRRDIREELLSVAIANFYKDMFFLRELYKLKIESRDAAGVAGVVKQMTQQYPDEIEPIYYGLKVAILTAKIETYYRFRKMALEKKMPRNALLLLDFGFELMSGKHYEALACLKEIGTRFGPNHYYVTLLEYVAHDFISEDEKKVKQAKKAMIDSLDQYCMKLIKIKNT
jgi:hypothetical protein